MNNKNDMSDNCNIHPFISVIIPVYNGEKTIKETLKSVLNQTYSHFEVIIVDDGSEQPVETFLQPYLEDNRIRVLRTERSNANIARNHGIENCHGEYIAMLDADDLWLENHLQDCLALLHASKADGLYGSLLMRRFLSDTICNLPVFQARALTEGESMIDYLLTTGYGAQTSTLFTKASCMKDIRWDPGLIGHQDYDFVVRFQKKYVMTVKEEPSTVYYLSSGRSIHYETCIRFVEDNIKDINPLIYMRYNMNMYSWARQDKNGEKYIPYFRKEVTRYKECTHYLLYISICEPQNRFKEWIDKLKYIFYILKLKIEI